MNASEILKSIREGEQDGALDVIFESVAARRRELKSEEALRRAQSFSPPAGALATGAKVRIKPVVRPKYLAGATGVVTGVLDVNVRMVLDDPATAGRFGSKEFKCPKTLLEVL